MTDEAHAQGSPPNYPLITLAALGAVSLLASGVIYGVAAQDYIGDASWDYIGPVADAWIVVLFWIGVLCLIGALVATAVSFSLERALRSAGAPSSNASTERPTTASRPS